MAEQKKLYEGIPVGAVYEASQRSLRELKLSIKDEDAVGHTISAASRISMNSFGQDITLEMLEIGQATELTITTSSGQLSDWGEGKKIIERIINRIETEIDKIRAEGRIAPITSFAYGFSTASQAIPSRDNIGRAALAPVAKKKKSSGRGWRVGVIALALLWWLNSNGGRNFISSLLNSLIVETNIEMYDCDKAASLVKGESLQNAFGARFDIIQISTLKQVSKTNTKIVCTGRVSLSNGTSPQMRISVEKGPGEFEILYTVEPIF